MSFRRANVFMCAEYLPTQSAPERRLPYWAREKNTIFVLFLFTASRNESEAKHGLCYYVAVKIRVTIIRRREQHNSPRMSTKCVYVL